MSNILSTQFVRQPYALQRLLISIDCALIGGLPRDNIMFNMPPMSVMSQHRFHHLDSMDVVTMAIQSEQDLDVRDGMVRVFFQTEEVYQLALAEGNDQGDQGVAIARLAQDEPTAQAVKAYLTKQLVTIGDSDEIMRDNVQAVLTRYF